MWKGISLTLYLNSIHQVEVLADLAAAILSTWRKILYSQGLAPALYISSFIQKPQVSERDMRE